MSVVEGFNLNQLMDEQGRFMVGIYMKDGLRGLVELIKYIESRKQLFKQLIKEKTGKNIRKTPRRGNRLVELEHKLFAIHNAFENDADSNTPKVLIEPSSNHGYSTRMAELSKKSAIINTPVSSKYRTVNATSSITRQRNQSNDRNRGAELLNAHEGHDFCSATRCTKKTVEPTVVPERLTKKAIPKKSELIRKLEAKQKAVINNKEEMMKMKAERARRDREERAQRVLQNNKKKEQERAAAIRAIRQRELALEELHRYQASPVKGISRNVSRANSKSPSRLHLLHGNAPNFPSTTAFANGKAAKSKGGNSQSCEIEVHPIKSTLKRKGEVASPAVSIKRATTTHCEKETIEQLGGRDSLHSGIPSSDFKTPNDSKNDNLSTAKCHEDNIDDDNDNVERDKSIMGLMETDVGRISPEASVYIAGGGMNVAPKPAAEVQTSKPTACVDKIMNKESVAQCDKKEALELEREEVRGKLGLLDSSQLNNKNLMNVTTCSSYDMTPPKKSLPSTDENYNIDDLSSGDETDEEDHPKKKVPNWAQPVNLRRRLREQAKKPLHFMDSFFDKIETPDLGKIFSIPRSRYAKRTSSALWISPLANPREGVSLYYVLQRRK